MQGEFEMSMMGELKFFLGLKIHQGRERTFIHQTKYVKYMLKKFNMEKSKTMETPLHPGSVLDMSDEKSPVDPTMFRGMIGSLLYFMSSRPDIMFSICLCARFQVNPQESHLSAVKRIFRYLIGTAPLGPIYMRKVKISSLLDFATLIMLGIALN